MNDDQRSLGTTNNRLFFVLAAVGAGGASLYWAAMTLLLGVGALSGSVSGLQLVLPLVLIVLYALRGFQLLSGNVLAARRLIWLHIFGCGAAAIQIFTGHAVGILLALQAFKIVIHIFGGITAYLAQREPAPQLSL